VNKILYEATGIDLWALYEARGGKCSRSYMRYNMAEKFKFYRKLKKEVENRGMGFFVCSEEDPSINDRPVECANCCGTDYYKEFKNYNTATFNNVYKILLSNGQVTIEDIKKNFYSPNWELFEREWNKGIFEEILLDTKAVRRPDENVVYKLESNKIR